jgi:hypothetical protein
VVRRRATDESHIVGLVRERAPRQFESERANFDTPGRPDARLPVTNLVSPEWFAGERADPLLQHRDPIQKCSAADDLDTA